MVFLRLNGGSDFTTPQMADVTPKRWGPPSPGGTLAPSKGGEEAGIVNLGYLDPYHAFLGSHGKSFCSM